MFNQRAIEIQRLVMQYITQLKGMLASAAGVPGPAPAASKIKCVLHNGFPKLPAAFNLKDYNTKELVKLYHDYLSVHYGK